MSQTKHIGKNWVFLLKLAKDPSIFNMMLILIKHRITGNLEDIQI